LPPDLQESVVRSNAVEPEREYPDVGALTRAMTEGDEAAYAKFYEAYFDRLRRYLLVVTAGNEDAAREALQSALVRVVRHIKVFASDEVFWGWLTVLARSALFDQTRKRRRYLSFLDRFTSHAQFMPSVPSAADTKLLDLLENGLALLPRDERKLLEAKYLDGSSVQEIAAILHTSEKAVESRLVRIRRKLKAALLHQLKHEQ
jgi:RNA polymerase sigma-70 factor, ECF subfamily